MARKKNETVNIDAEALIDLVKLQYEQVCGARLAREWASKTKPPQGSGEVKEPETKEGMFRILEAFKNRLKLERENDGPLEREMFLPQEVIDYISAVNCVSLFGAWHCAEKLASDENETGSGLLSAEMAKTFLYLFEQLTRMKESASRRDSNDAAMYLGTCAMTYYASETGKTLGQIAVAHTSKSEGGHNTELIKSDEGKATMVEVWNKHEGEYQALKNTARELYDLGIKGRGGKGPISERRLREKLKAEGVEFGRNKGQGKR